MKTKSFGIKAAKSDDTGSFSGVGNVTGVLDRDREVVAKGAYGDLSSLEMDGFIPVGHDWYGLPVAMFKSAVETDEGLQFEAKWHSTQSAQDVRTIVNERLAEGKTVGLSIGYGVKSSREFGTVDELAAYCESAGIPFDRASAKGYNGYCRLLEKLDVFEISVVTVPANAQSGIRSGKRFSGGTCSLSDHSKGLLAESSDYVTRMTDLHGKRDSELSGRSLSDMQDVIVALRKNADALEALVPAVETTPAEVETPATPPAEPAQDAATEPTPEQKALVARWLNP